MKPQNPYVEPPLPDNSSPPEAKPSVIRKILAILGKIGAVLLVLIAVAFGGAIGKQAVKAYFNFRDRPLEITETAWTRYTLMEVNVDSPFRFGPAKDMRGKLARDLRTLIESVEVYQSQTSGNFFVMVVRMVCAPHIQANREGAVEFGMAHFAKRVGDPNPQYSNSLITVRGMRGCKTTYRGTHTSGQIVRLELLTVVDKNKLWQVFVSYDNATAQYVSRILDSVAITQSEPEVRKALPADAPEVRKALPANAPDRFLPPPLNSLEPEPTRAPSTR